MMTTANRPRNWPSGETDDAAEWARAMSDVFTRLINEDDRPWDDSVNDILDPTPGGLLHAWLCNAIETGKAFGASREARTGEHAASMRAALGDGWRDQ